MIFFKEHASEYFSLYYFQNQVVSISSSFFKHDTSYLRGLVRYFKETFPRKYQNSFEGRSMLLTLESVIEPPSANTPTPQFSVADVFGKTISSNSLKGTYVLLDFWASWCSPCLASIPFLKELISRYPSSSLKVVGINIDEKIQEMNKTIAERKIDWVQIFDNNDIMSNTFGVVKIPLFILLNKQGKIIFRGTGLEDKEKLSVLLKQELY